MRFSFTAACQRARNKGSKNGAAVLIMFPSHKGFKAVVVDDVVGGGSYWFE